MEKPTAPATGHIILVSTPATGGQADVHRGYIVAEEDSQTAINLVTKSTHSGETVEDLGNISGARLTAAIDVPGKKLKL